MVDGRSAVRWLRRRLAGQRAGDAIESALVRRYVWSGRVPFSPGYGEYRRRYVRSLLADTALLRAFREGGPLPPAHGYRLDERVVEYPWVFSRVDVWGRRVLDAGGALDHQDLRAHPEIARRTVVIVSLAHEAGRVAGRHVIADLRRLALRDEAVDTVVCVSTIEHVGLDNTRLYTPEARFREDDRGAWRPALGELVRVLRPGGRLLLTVPFGKARTFGWMQQFDRAGVEAMLDAAGGTPVDVAFFRYDATGWRRADAAACADCEYFDVHAGQGMPADGAAAARAVACIELIR